MCFMPAIGNHSAMCQPVPAAHFAAIGGHLKALHMLVTSAGAMGHTVLEDSSLFDLVCDLGLVDVVRYLVFRVPRFWERLLQPASSRENHHQSLRLLSLVSREFGMASLQSFEFSLLPVLNVDRTHRAGKLMLDRWVHSPRFALERTNWPRIQGLRHELSCIEECFRVLCVSCANVPVPVSSHEPLPTLVLSGIVRRQTQVDLIACERVAPPPFLCE